MAIIKCKECGKEISNKAQCCPHCGCPSGIGAPRNAAPAGPSQGKRRTPYAPAIKICLTIILINCGIWFVLAVMAIASSADKKASSARSSGSLRTEDIKSADAAKSLTSPVSEAPNSENNGEISQRKPQSSAGSSDTLRAGAQPAQDTRRADSADTSSQDSSRDNSSGMTIGQKNALASAKSYLSFSSFSRQGLIHQLEFEQFSNADAVYAADNCGADWNEQAKKDAESYLRFSAFSYEGMIKQLEFEGFTHEQAVYGADSCGADWNEQAALSAKSYLSFSSFSRDSLIDQLVFEGFTYDQAVYGVQANGY